MRSLRGNPPPGVNVGVTVVRVVAVKSFEYRPTRTLVRRGQVFDDTDPIVEGTPDDWWRADTEQATAAPGERRTVKRPRGKK